MVNPERKKKVLHVGCDLKQDFNPLKSLQMMIGRRLGLILIQPLTRLQILLVLWLTYP